MFVIHPENPSDWANAMFIMSYYKELHCEMFSDGENDETAYMVVSAAPPGYDLPSDEALNNLRMAEMAFQMNWHQKSHFRCGHCDALPDPLREKTCGHLTFNKIINPAF
jgi:hypothetical protein